MPHIRSENNGPVLITEETGVIEYIFVFDDLIFSFLHFQSIDNNTVGQFEVPSRIVYGLNGGIF